MRYIFLGPPVHFLVFHRAPRTLDENVVAPRAATIHADLDFVADQHTSEGGSGELRALIGVEDLGLVVARQSVLQRPEAELRALGALRMPRGVCPVLLHHLRSDWRPKPLPSPNLRACARSRHFLPKGKATHRSLANNRLLPQGENISTPFEIKPSLPQPGKNIVIKSGRTNPLLLFLMGDVPAISARHMRAIDFK